VPWHCVAVILSARSCSSTGKAIPKDKAIKRFIVRCPVMSWTSMELDAHSLPCGGDCRNIVDASSMRDIREASAIENYALPKVCARAVLAIFPRDSWVTILLACSFTSSSITVWRLLSTSASCDHAQPQTARTATHPSASENHPTKCRIVLSSAVQSLSPPLVSASAVFPFAWTA
jgi:ribosomal protein S26